jgi:hypothetical protein
MSRPVSVVHITPERFRSGSTFPQYLEEVRKNQEFWRGVYRTARLPDEVVSRARTLPGSWGLLALSEDWCGDAVNTLPIVARLVEVNAGIDFRVLRRDENPDLMNAHLTHGLRSIPVVMVLDERFVERGWWGPRPAALQQWYEEHARALDPPERSRRKREWYARDRGISTAREVLALLESVAEASSAPRAAG